MCKDGENLASCIKTLSEESVSGATHIYYHSSNLPLSAADNSYRYAGSSESVNNFVCFGSTAIPCPMDNLYRIIGVIDGQVKLIKHNYASSTLLGTDGDYYRDIRYYWNYVATKDSSNGYGLNSWDTSLLNKTNLNTNFINNIGTEWANKISNSTWKVSGYNFLGLTAKEMYNVEIGNATKTFVDSNGMSKIGLMYASDYGFAASSNAWVLKMSDYDDCSANNWMSLGNVELTISPYTSRVSYIYYISAKGYLNSGGITFSAGYVRPSFYLNSTVTYKSGSGTQSDPIIIN